MAKTEVYSWRVKAETKAALEEEARARGVSLAVLLEEVAAQILSRPASGGADEEAEQQRLRRRAQRYFGSIRGDDPDRASQVRERVRERLRRRRVSG